MDEQVWPTDLEGRDVRGTQTARLGAVTAVYADDGTELPEWVSVRVADADGAERMVPLLHGQLQNAEVHVPYTREQVLGAPRVGGAGHLTSVEEAELAAYYDIEYRTAESETGLPTAGLPPATRDG